MYFNYIDESTVRINIHNEVTETMSLIVTEGLTQIESDSNVKEVQVSICSGGGSVIAGYSIYSALKLSSKSVTIYNHGIAASIAAIIFLAAPIQNRYATSHSLFMLHNPSGGSEQGLAAIKDSLIKILSDAFNSEGLDQILSNETWFSAEQLKESGIIKDIIPTETLIQSDILTNYYNSICDLLNAKNKIKIDQNMDQIKNDAPEIAVNTELDEAKKVIESLTNELNELKNKIKAETEAKEQAEKVEVLTEAGIEAKNHANWTSLSLDTIKSLTSTFAVNKIAPVNTVKKITNYSDLTVEDFKNMSDVQKDELAKADIKTYYNLFKQVK